MVHRRFYFLFSIKLWLINLDSSLQKSHNHSQFPAWPHYDTRAVNPIEFQCDHLCNCTINHPVFYCVSRMTTLSACTHGQRNVGHHDGFMIATDASVCMVQRIAGAYQYVPQGYRIVDFEHKYYFIFCTFPGSHSRTPWNTT